ICNENEAVDSRRSVGRIKLQTRSWSKSLIVQLVKYSEFCWRIFPYAKKKQITMVNIHSLSLLPLGICLKIMLGAKLIYDTHELETEVTGLKDLRKYLAKCIERLGIHFADHIFVVSESIADHYVKKYNITRPTVVFNTPNFCSPKNSNLLRESININDDIKILLYAGKLMQGRGIETILEAFTKKMNQRVVVVFMGYGPLEDRIKKKSENYPNIFFYPAVPPDKVVEYMSSADVGITIIENYCLSNYYCMPNKLFEYIMAGLPVIASNMFEMAKFVTDNNLGVIAVEETPEAVISAIETLYKKDLCVLRESAQKASKLNSWEVQEKKMISAYKSFLQQ
ncbi:MAG: glycosyltransferase, partial [Candidatus Electrothrix sp. ATG2]|nr:glycosyltransferase [Candidatus Electrothrix sp. ATG2]